MPVEPSAPPQEPISPPTPPSAPEVVTTPEASSAEAQTLRDLVASAGYDVSSFQDDNTLGRSLLQVAEQYQNERELIDAGKLYLQNAAAFQRWQEEQEQAKAPAPAPEPEAPKWSIPSFNPEWEKITRWDADTGRYVPASIYVNPRAADERNAYHAAQRQYLEKVIQNPWDAAREAGAEQWFAEREKQLLERMQAMFQQYTTYQQTQNYVTQQQREFYVFDDNDQPVIDRRTGEQQMTPKGEAFLTAAIEARQLGITDPNAVRNYAEQKVEYLTLKGAFGAPTSPAGQPTMTASPEPEAPKPRFADRAKRKPNRDGMDADGVSVNPEATLRELNRKALAKKGLLPQTG